MAEAVGWLDVGAPGRAREVLLEWLQEPRREPIEAPINSMNWQEQVAREIQRCNQAKSP